MFLLLKDTANILIFLETKSCFRTFFKKYVFKQKKHLFISTKSIIFAKVK